MKGLYEIIVHCVGTLNVFFKNFHRFYSVIPQFHSIVSGWWLADLESLCLLCL